MYKLSIFIFLFFHVTFLTAQVSAQEIETTLQDSIKKKEFIKQLGNGFFTTKYFNFDLRYLIKYNQFEGVRTGFGGITNDAFSKKLRLNSYGVYGFRDHRFKYGLGASYLLSESHNTWLSLGYSDDLQETGSTKFLTDKRFFQFFEPRLLNIDLFHKIITKSIGIEHNISEALSAQSEFTINNIKPTYNYTYISNNTTYNAFNLSIAKFALQFKPNMGSKTEKNEFPIITLQYTKSFEDVFKGDLSFSKIDFRTIHQILHKNNNISEITIVGGMASGNTPLTHLYHAYPNNITKETIMQRFSVAGINSFETMFFNEFFSDKFTTFQLKHYLKPFQISERYKPQMVLITRYALGNVNNTEKHQNVSFGSLNKGYTESGFEINKLLFGFGLSFTYRYGAYHLPSIDDNVAFKFTFNVSL